MGAEGKVETSIANGAPRCANQTLRQPLAFRKSNRFDPGMTVEKQSVFR